MSRRPINLSADLARLQDEGYTLRIVRGRLVVGDVPYVDIEGQVRDDGRLVMNLTLAGETTTTPDDHTAYFVGGIPCDTHGVPLEKMINNKNATDLGDSLVAACYFSAKVKEDGVHRNYRDYHEKVTVYVGRISGPAGALDPPATARRHRPVPAEDGDHGPFRYIDTASSRAGIDVLNLKLAEEKVGIIGLGGTGEYILDYVSKTEVAAIHLFVAKSGPLTGQRHPYVYQLVLALQHQGWRWIETYIWAKSNAVPGRFGPRTKDSFEYVYAFAKGAKPLFNIDAIRVPYKATADEIQRRSLDTLGRRNTEAGFGRDRTKTYLHGGADPGNVVTVPQTYNQHRGVAHTAAMPEGLAEFFIKACSPPDGVVIDPFAGSGTTTVVAHRLGRQAGGLDIHAAHVEEALRRIAADEADDPPGALQIATG